MKILGISFQIENCLIKFFRPQEIDEAARRRLVKRLYIPLPDMPARRQLVLNLMKQQPYELTEQEIDLVCTRTDGN